MSPCEWNAVIAAIANSLAGRLTRRELAFWGLFLSHLGDSLESIAAFGELFDHDEEISPLTPGGSNE